MYHIIYNFDIAGIVLLFVALVPTFKLMRELPPGQMRTRWKVLSVMIVFFIVSYLYIAWQHRIDAPIFGIEAVLLLLFFGALFVLLVSALSLQTALDVKHIYALEIESITDPIMGIGNRRYLERKLNEEFAKARRYKLPLSLLMIDIDHFKEVNDTFGHDAGDIVLKNLGMLINKFDRESDYAARYGGEEIVIITPLTDGPHAAFIAERLRKKIEAILKRSIPLGILDITLYRDDLTTVSSHPVLRETSIPFDIHNLSLVLVDDVLYTGRTIRAALDGITDLGRPKRIQLAVLVDRGSRELPIQADYVGKRVEIAEGETIEVRLLEQDREEKVILMKKT